jgi:hypothetical protein
LSPQEAVKAVQRLRELCVTKGAELQELEAAAKALRDSGYKQELTHVLREAINWPQSHPRVGALWVRRLVSSNNWDRTYPGAMDELCKRGEIGHCAVIEFLEIVSAKGRRNLVRQAVHTHARWLRKHEVGWAVAARALANARLYRMAADWMSDWRNRPEFDLPLLCSLSLALRGVGREKEAHEVVQMALTKPGAGQVFPVLKLWYAQEEALAGNAEKAGAELKELRPAGWDEDLVCLFYLARGVVRVQRSEPEARKQAFESAYARIRDQFRRKRIYQRDLMLRRQYRRCLSRMARDAGIWATRLVASWRSADRWSTLIALLLVPGLQLVAPVYLLRICTNRHGREK